MCTVHHLHIIIQETVILLTIEEAQGHPQATAALVVVVVAHDLVAVAAVEVLEALLEAVAVAEGVKLILNFLFH